MKSKLMRINIDLADEIKRVAEKNQIKQIEASKQLADMIKSNKNKSLIREIKF